MDGNFTFTYSTKIILHTNFCDIKGFFCLSFFFQINMIFTECIWLRPDQPKLSSVKSQRLYKEPLSVVGVALASHFSCASSPSEHEWADGQGTGPAAGGSEEDGQSAGQSDRGRGLSLWNSLKHQTLNTFKVCCQEKKQVKVMSSQDESTRCMTENFA